MPKKKPVQESEAMVGETEVVEAIFSLEEQLAQVFNNTNRAMGQIQEQFSLQLQMCLEIARSKFGHPMSDEAQAFKVAIERHTADLAAEQEAIDKALKEADDSEGTTEPEA